MRFQTLLTWRMACKDLRLFVADRRGLVLCFAVPILLASLFGAVFDRPAGEAIRLPLLVVAEDDGPLTTRVVAALLADDHLEARRCDRAEATKQLGRRGSGVVVVLPNGFSRLTQGERPVVQLLHHPSCRLEANCAEGVVTEVVLRETAAEMFTPLLGTVHPGFTTERPFTVEQTAAAGPGGVSLNAYSHSFCGMTLQYLLFWGMDSGLLLLRERRQGIWRRLRTTPLTLTALLSGKVLATSMVALAQIGVAFGFGAVVFGVRLTGSPAGFLALALAAALLSATTGLVVAALGGSEGRARSVAVLIILTSSMLGGFWLPSFLLPHWVQEAALALPTTWAARGFAGVTWQGMGVVEALHCAAVVVGFSAAFLGLALWGFARAEARMIHEGVGA
jgi:ABC-2 type transport system permease protein